MPFDPNPYQYDCDNDSQGDACDPDTVDIDNDRIDIFCDNCPEDDNPDQENTDSDDFGDACDNCPEDDNPDQENTDSDDFGDACDNCPEDDNPDQEDTDSDDFGDACDNCPEDDNPDQEDTDSDDFGDVCDNDDDNDGILDNDDNCPLINNPDQTDYDRDGMGDSCDYHPYIPDLISIAGGHYYHEQGIACSPFHCFDVESSGISNMIKVGYQFQVGHRFKTYNKMIGVLEFDISSIGDLFTSNTNEVHLFLTLKEGALSKDNCLTFYDIQDASENGVIEEADISVADSIGEICKRFQPGNTITLDVTPSIEHDLFDPNQTEFSGFIIERSTDWEGSIEFYDHTDPVYAPRLIIMGNNSCPILQIFGEGSEEVKLLRDFRDSILNTTLIGRGLISLYYELSPVFSNALEEDEGLKEDVKGLIDGTLPIISGFLSCDTYSNATTFQASVLGKTHEGQELMRLFSQWSPAVTQILGAEGFNEELREMIAEVMPVIGSIGNGCDCEGNFDCDDDCDGSDAHIFKLSFGRSPIMTPCTIDNPCNGDNDCDGDVDGFDAFVFKQDFGRNQLNNPCPVYVVKKGCSSY